MNLLLQLLLVCLSLAVLIARAQVYLPLNNDEVVDHPIVDVQLGVPPQTLHLALALDHQSVSTLCDASLEFVLFEPSQTFRHRSRSYETIVPQLAGQDIAEVAGTRFWATIGFDPMAGTRFSALFPTLSPAVDGVFCLGLEQDIRSPLIWSALLADRHGVRLVYEEQQQQDQQQQHSQQFRVEEFGRTLEMVDHDKYGWMGCLDAVQVSIGTTRIKDDNTYRLCLLPHASTLSYLPQHLYDQYWRQVALSNGNDDQTSSLIYESTSMSTLQWPILKLASADGTLVLNLGGPQVLPLMEGIKSLDLSTGIPRPSAPSGGSGGTSSSGDVLKVLSHRQSNETSLILLAGHALWSSTQMLITWDDTAAIPVQLAARARSHERLLTSWQALLVLLIVFLYIRWKMLRQRFDALLFDDAAERAYDYTIHYRFRLQSGAENLIWPWLVPLWLAPLVYLTRSRNLTITALDSQGLATFEIFAAILGVMAYAGMVVIMILVDGRKTWQAWADLARFMRLRVFSWQAPWVQALLPPSSGNSLYSRQKKDLAIVLEQDVVWQEDSEEYKDAMRAQGIHKRQRNAVYPLYEHNLSVSLVRDVAIDYLMAASAWLFFGPLHSRIFSQPVIFVALSLFVFTTVYHFFLYLMALAWPMVASKRAFGRVRKRLQPSLLEWLCLGFLAAMVAFSCWFLVVASLRGLLEVMGSSYTATTLALSIIVVIFLATLAVIANSIADFDLQTRLFSKDADQLSTRQGRS
jgi:hypothetical protein